MVHVYKLFQNKDCSHCWVWLPCSMEVSAYTWDPATVTVPLLLELLLADWLLWASTVPPFDEVLPLKLEKVLRMCCVWDSEWHKASYISSLNASALGFTDAGPATRIYRCRSSCFVSMCFGHAAFHYRRFQRLLSSLFLPDNVEMWNLKMRHLSF